MSFRSAVRALPRPALLAAAAAIGALCAAPAPLRAADVAVAVRSLNPDSGVLIAACCGEVCTLQVMPTPFDLLCAAGSPVDLSAPPQAGPGDDTPFTEWRWGTPPSFFTASPTTRVTVTGDSVLTAVYGTPPPVVTHPDFSVDSIVLDPASPVSGTTFTATVAVSNHGEAQAAAGYLAVWKDRADVPACRDARDDFAAFGWLAAGASQTRVFTGLLAGPAGAATFRAFADYNCGFAEGDEADNHAALAYMVRARRTLDVRSATPSSGVPAIVGASDLLGRGDGSTPFSRSYADGRSVPLAVPPLASGNVFQHWLRDGAHFSDATSITAAMDADHVFTAVYAPPPLPDFSVTDLTVLPASPVAGIAFSASVTVRNSGTVAGDAGTLALWADKVGNPACTWADASFLQAVGRLEAGESRTYSFFPVGPVVAGTRYLRAYVDAECETVELTDNDNQSYKSYLAVTRETKSILVDTLDGRAADVAHTMDVSGRTAGRTQFTRVYPSGVTVTLTAAATTPDGGVFQKWVGLEPAVATDPAVTLLMNVDHAVRAVYVGPGEPDFAVTGIVLDPPDPPAGRSFSATVTIANVGTGRGVPGVIKLFPDRSSPAGCRAWTPYGPGYETSLAAGASITRTVGGIPAGAPGGKTLLAFVDDFCETDEPDEANNQHFLPYEVVNVAPVLAPIGDRAVAEGDALTFAVAATDTNGDALTYAASGLPEGARFDPTTGIFSWRPGYEAAGSYPGVRFAVGDGEATDEETIAIDVAEPAGPVFVERFEDAGPDGDVDWIRVSGKWTGGGGVFAASSKALFSLARVARLEPDALPIRAGIVRANVRLAAAAASPPGPNALIVFAYRDAGHYRWVRITPTRVQIGQRGGMDGVETGIKRNVAAAAPVGRWYRYTVRIEEDGRVRVYRGAATVPLASCRFARGDGSPSVVAGGVGLAASRAWAHFDDVVVREGSALAPP